MNSRIAMPHTTERAPTIDPTRVTLRVLIVEDEDAARIATRRYLQNCGHEVEAAGTAAEAMAKADELRPEVLVCDWKLATEPEGDGVAVARLLQKKFGVAVIFMTAYALNDLRRNIGGLGSVDCLRKPISLNTLAAAVLSSAPSPAAHR
jgi:sigma-B regulation protein RsbU (phosphoserine phosphatase)